MRLYRDTYLDRKTGKRKKAKKWMVDVRVGGGRVRLAGFADKAASEQLGRRVERLANLKDAGGVPDPLLTAWLEQLPMALRENLARVGLLDVKRLNATRPLYRKDEETETDPALLDEFRASLEARGASKQHVTQTVGRIRSVFESCGFDSWHEIDALTADSHLSKRRKGTESTPGISVKTSNYVLQAVRQFCGWMVDNGLATHDPLRVLKPLNPRTDVRLVRRALTPKEIRRLLQSTSDGPTRDGVTGPARAMVYRLAVETGLRRAELMSLRMASFNLADDAPTVTVQAAYSKRRRDDVLPLRPSTAKALAAFLADRMPMAPAFALPKFWDSATMLQEDLADAGVLARDEDQQIVTTDEQGRVVDFHALRHTFISNLACGGVSPKVAQALARHSTITLTLDRYTHLRAEDEVKALQALPDLDAIDADDQPSPARKLAP